jgi:predicted acylesterase/phospholipase RssA/CRP-like cAMP-binding protein
MQNVRDESGQGGKIRFLSRHPLFEGLADSELLDVEAQATTILLEPGEGLFQPPDFTDSLYIVVSGLLHVLGHPESANRARLAPGDLWGGAAMRVHMPGATSVVAVEPSEVMSIPASAVDRVAQSRPSLRGAITAATSRHLLRMRLALIPRLAGLDDSLFSYLACHSEFLRVKRGEIVIHQGEKADCLYIVASGSVEVFTKQNDGTEHATIDLLGEGACLGELALLLNEPRTASARAWRDSLLIRVPAHCFEQILHSNTEVAVRLARTLSERLKRTTMSSRRTIPVKTIAVLPWCEGPRFAAFCERLKLAFQRAGCKVAVLTSAMREETGGRSPDRDAGHDPYSAWLAAQEAAHQYVLCQCDDNLSDWTQRSLQQADLALFVCVPGGGQPSGQGVAAARQSGARLELVLLQGSPFPLPGTSSWLESGGFSAHHHVGLENDQDYQRLVRRLTGKAWGLVLSGGGARGLAHIGVIRALRESGLPIDMVGGTSMGAIIAAQCAMGCDPEAMLAMSRKAYVERSGPKDLTVPLVSLRTGRATIRTLKQMFGDRRIEDLPISYFCVSCNLTRADVVIHDRGPVWMWTRVSCAVPGLVPPVPYRGDVLVDGGFLDNLPVGAMRKRLGGYVVASDVSVAVDLAVSGELECEASWSGVSQLLRRLTNRPRLPNFVDMLMRTAEIASVRDSRTSGNPADLYLHPPVDDISMTDFQAIDRIVAIGYEYTLRRLEEWKSTHRTDLAQGVV